MIVAEADGKPAGFLLSLMAGNKRIIDLIAVEPRHLRRGLGRQMIEFLARNCARENAVDTIAVGTQVANLAAAGLYENLGFRLVASSYVLHHHGAQDRRKGTA